MPMPDGSGLSGVEQKEAVRNLLLPLSVRGLTYRVGAEALIDGINLTVDSAGVTMVLGANGAGKSLLLRLLHGLIEPSAGAIEWGGSPLSRETKQRQAMLFQKPMLLRRSVAANLDFVLAARGVRDAPRRDALLAQVGLEDHARRPARRLSGGEQQRLALACALAHRPDVLFLDEPTASLDPASTQRIEALVVAAHEAGTKIIGVSHDIGQARRLADDIIFMHRGQIAEAATAEAFFASPQSDAAKAYLSGRIVV